MVKVLLLVGVCLGALVNIGCTTEVRGTEVWACDTLPGIGYACINTGMHAS